MEKLKSFLEKNNFEYYEKFNLSCISSIKLGDVASIVIFPSTKSQLQKVIEYFCLKKIYFKIIGNASNLLFVDNIKYPIISTSKMIDEIKICGGQVEVSAGMLISRFSDFLRKNSLSGFEGLANIPATIGGAIKNGAGAFGYNIFDKLLSIVAIFNGKIVNIDKSQINFKHHYSNLNGVFILSAKFLFENKNEYDIMKNVNKFSYLRSKSQPLGLSLGSVFQNSLDKSAGFFIERSGLKGKKIGGIEISKKHANFFVNDGTGSVVDFLNLLQMVKKEVEMQFGVNLLTEIEKVENFYETDSRLSHSFKQFEI